MLSGIRLIIIDSSVVLKRTISIKLINDSQLQLVAAVNNTIEAADKIKFFKPDAIILGIDSIDMSNLRSIEQFVSEVKTPLVIITNDSAKILHLTRAARIEFVARPPLGDVKLAEQTANDVIAKVKRLSGSGAPSAIPQRPAATMAQTPNLSAGFTHPKTLDPNIRSVYQIQGKNAEKPMLTSSIYNNFLIAIGSSTGGTEAVYAFLTKLPQDMPPILITQHMPPVFTKLYADRLNMNCKMEVREGANGDVLSPGLALVAPGDKQMCLTRRGGKLAVECVRTDKVSGHCPSVDLLFESVASVMGRNAIGIIMTGMGKDGAQGMLLMHSKGAFTIGQDQESSVVYGMPKVAYEIGAVDIQAPPDRIPEIIAKALRERVR